MQLAAPAGHAEGRVMSVLRLLSRTKLYWGLIAIFLIGVLTSPVSSKGNNIFLSYGNLLDVLRQVSITGLIATGMTAVIITGGIDLSVGSLMAICSVVCAMLLTVPGWTRPPRRWACRRLALAVFVIARRRHPLRLPQRRARGRACAGGGAASRSTRSRRALIPAGVGLAGVALALCGSCCRRSRPSSACSAC